MALDNASWYDSSWAYRYPVVVNNTSAGGTQDVSFNLPADFDLLWDNVETDGKDIRFTYPDGFNLATASGYELSGFSVANRTGTVEIQDVAFSATAAQTVLWMYWGNSGASAISSAQTLTSAINGAFFFGRPIGPFGRGAPERPGDTAPTTEISKIAAEEIYVWWNLTRALQKRSKAYNGTIGYEAISTIETFVDLAGADQSAMHDASRVKLVENDEGMWVGARYDAGSSGTTYTAGIRCETAITFPTTSLRIIERRFLLKVQDPDET